MWGMSAKWRSDKKSKKGMEPEPNNFLKNLQPSDDFVTLTESDFELALHSDTDTDEAPSSLKVEDESDKIMDTTSALSTPDNLAEKKDDKSSDNLDDHETEPNSNQDIPVEGALEEENTLSDVENDVPVLSVPELTTLMHEISDDNQIETDVKENTETNPKPPDCECKPCYVVIQRLYGCVKPCSVLLDRNEVLNNKPGKTDTKKKSLENKKKKTSSYGDAYNLKPLNAVLSKEEMLQHYNQKKSSQEVFAKEKKLLKGKKIIQSLLIKKNSNIQIEKRVQHFVICRICSKIYSSQLELKLHIDKRHTPKLYCKFCRSKLNNLMDLHKHVLKTHGVKPFCKNCKEIFYSLYLLEKHEERCRSLKKLTV